MSANPLEWLGTQLEDLEGVLERAGVLADETTATDAAALRDCTPEILSAVDRLLGRVKVGELGRLPSGKPLTNARVGWR